jgi:lysophospholipase L1-like esterase
MINKPILSVFIALLLVSQIYASEQEIDWNFLREQVKDAPFNKMIVEGLNDYLQEHPDNETIYNFTYNLYINTLAETQAVAQAESLFQKNLSIGLNLISIPTSGNLPEILYSIEGSYKYVFYYDIDWKSFVPGRMNNSLNKINETMGLFLIMNKSDTIILQSAPSVIEFNLREGWNLIGHPSLSVSTYDNVFGNVNNSIEEIFSYDGNWLSPADINPGEGFWVKLKENTTWIFDGRFWEKLSPNTMSALGDSITIAYNTEGSILSGSRGYPQHSWSTGDDSADIVYSHYERLLDINNSIMNNNYNNAVERAMMSDLLGQAQNTIPQNPRYITILMGSNDACADSLAEMTDLTTFEAGFRQSMDLLANLTPNIYVVGLPDIYQLYSVGNAKGCSWLWGLRPICRALTSSSNTEADRLTFRQRVIDYNEILKNVTQEYKKKYTNSAFEVQFTTSDIAWDCFHPSLQGQMKLANVTWNDGYW